MIGIRRCTLLVFCATAALALPGCARPGAGAPTIATTWPVADQAALESEFRRWAEATREAAAPAAPFAWLRLAPGEDLGRGAARDPHIDVLLGGSATQYRRLAGRGRLAPIEQPGLPLWT